jgi:hypothetical protein
MGSKGVAGVPTPVINLSLTNATNNVILNSGTGGATYNATVTNYSTSENHVSNANGLTLYKRAYAKVNYGLSASKSFTICVRGSIKTASSLSYQMLFWTEKDTISAYRANSAGNFNIKITGSTTGIVADSSKANATSKALNINTSYISYYNDHTYVFIGNTETGVINLYIDGELIGHQTMSTLPTSTSILLGDNTGKYYANQISISDVRVWDCAVDINSI